MSMFDDPNRQAVGLDPIWTGAGEEPTEPPPELEDLPAGVAVHTVDQVKAWVDAHPHYAADVLTHERARGTAARVTLVDWLDGFIESHDGVG